MYYNNIILFVLNVYRWVLIRIYIDSECLLVVVGKESCDRARLPDFHTARFFAKIVITLLYCRHAVRVTEIADMIKIVLSSSEDEDQTAQAIPY